jgi:undecaprenyl-diphosphatase
MISRLHALMLGAVQGLTEFLPVSSSAHLVLIPWLCRWKDPGLAFDVVLHLGTLLALVIYYWQEWIDMALSLVNHDRRKRRLLMHLIVATVPGAIIGFTLEKQAETVFRSPMLIAIAMAILGVVLWVIDRISSQTRTIDEITYLDAVLIGLSQAAAIIPGVSRSGATITAARLVSMDRADAANFSFLMATPIIAGAGLLEVRHLIREGLNPQLLLGFGAAAVFGLIAIAGLIRFVRVRTYMGFAWYRIVAAAFVIAVFLARG